MPSTAKHTGDIVSDLTESRVKRPNARHEFFEYLRLWPRMFRLRWCRRDGSDLLLKFWPQCIEELCDAGIGTGCEASWFND